MYGTPAHTARSAAQKEAASWMISDAVRRLVIRLPYYLNLHSRISVQCPEMAAAAAIIGLTESGSPCSLCPMW